MKIILLILFLIICPMLLGGGFASLTGLFSSKRIRFSISDSFSLGVLILFLIAGVSNAISWFLSFNIAYASRVFAVLLILTLTVAYFLTVIKSFKKYKDRASDKEKGIPVKTPVKVFFAYKLNVVLLILCILLSLVPAAVIVLSVPDFHGDQTLETVRSFQYTGEMYSVNPLTGLPYGTGGLPSRVPFMCIPFLYTVLCNTFSCDAALLVWRIMPVFWLVTGYFCFVRIGLSLFEEVKKRFIFYAVCVLLLFSLSAGPHLIGYDALFSGFSSISIVALVLTTWTVGTALKKKWVALLLPVIIEPLVTSTLFGLGACFVIGLGMFIASRFTAGKRRAA